MNNDGQIDFDEFLKFWEIVKKAGYSEKEICEELVRIKDREAWVGFMNLPQKQISSQATRKDLSPKVQHMDEPESPDVKKMVRILE